MTSSKVFLGPSRNIRWLLPLFLVSALFPFNMLFYLPEAGRGKITMFVACVAIGWFWIGGAFAIAHLSRHILQRRALAVTRREIEAAAGPIWVCDPDGQVLLQNAATLGEIGDITGRNINVLISKFRADCDGARLDWSAQAIRDGMAEIMLCENIALVVRWTPGPAQLRWSINYPDDINKNNLFTSYYQNNLEDLELLPVALLRLTSDGHILYANAAAWRLLRDFISDKSKNIICLGDIFDDLNQSAGSWLDDMMSRRVEDRTEMLRLRSPECPDMTGRYIQIALSPTASDSSDVLMALTDASELKTLEAQFVQSQKMQAIGQLAGGIAHDFNNLLTAIRGHCDLLMLRHDKSDTDYADLDQISQNANRAAALVGQLLSFSRKQTLKLERLDLRDILADLAHLLNRLVGGRASLQISHDPSLKPIRADRRLLEQVIMNLVVNARDAMLEGGEIRLATENRILDMPLMQKGNTLPAGEYVCITVTDTGCGISPQNMSKIFEPFFTTKAVGEGTGLGLSTVYGIVRQTGGHILCDSEPGRGTCFSIYLPAQPEGEYEPSASPDSPGAVFPVIPDRPATILLVEDEASVRAVAARALNLKGYEVHEADGAEAALALLADAEFTPDLFVTDVIMPGMDGPGWVRLALEDRPGTKVVFMSGYSEDVFGNDQLPVPHSVFLAKPFTLTELVQVVQGQLAEPVIAGASGR
ncbi:ATP-binding response regulator [Paracoccus onubensis]|nr:ATP-binding protein [Paracoccus onubensis]